MMFSELSFIVVNDVCMWMALSVRSSLNREGIFLITAHFQPQNFSVVNCHVNTQREKNRGGNKVGQLVSYCLCWTVIIALPSLYSRQQQPLLDNDYCPSIIIQQTATNLVFYTVQVTAFVHRGQVTLEITALQLSLHKHWTVTALLQYTMDSCNSAVYKTSSIDTLI